MAWYGKKAKKAVHKEMRRFKKGTAHSGRKHKKVKSRKQAIAIGLSKARKKGAKVPKKSTGMKKRTTKRRTTKKLLRQHDLVHNHTALVSALLNHLAV